MNYSEIRKMRKATYEERKAIRNQMYEAMKSEQYDLHAELARKYDELIGRYDVLAEIEEILFYEEHPVIEADNNVVVDNLEQLDTLVQKEVLSEEEVIAILSYYLIYYKNHNDWFGCTGVDGIYFTYEYILNYRKDGQIALKFKSEYQLL